MHAHPLFRRMYQRGWKLVPLMPIFHVCITYCVTLLSALPKASFYLGTQRCAQSVSMYVSFSGHARMHVYVCVCGRMYRFDALGNEPVFDTPVFPSSVILTKPSSSAVCDLWNDETDWMRVYCFIRAVVWIGMWSGSCVPFWEGWLGIDEVFTDVRVRERSYLYCHSNCECLCKFIFLWIQLM